MIPQARHRVTEHTSEKVNHRIARQMREDIRHYAAAGPEAIQRRLDELEAEWDIERTLEANAATLNLLGLLLGSTVDRKWYMLSGVVAGFLLQHAIQGWCPPVPVFRRMGIRTTEEIDAERYALRMIRGDFDGASHAGAGPDIERIADAVLEMR